MVVFCCGGDEPGTMFQLERGQQLVLSCYSGGAEN
jgi:hypothetical protein